MQSPLKKIIVYDLETGGLNKDHNSITEIAMVAIDLQDLSIIDEMSVMLKPRIDLNNSRIFEKPAKGEELDFNQIYKDEAKDLYKRLGEKDSDTEIKTLMYGKEKITLKNLDPLIAGIEKFSDKILSEYRSGILELKDIEDFEASDLKDIFAVYCENAYTTEAAEITKISRKMLVENGVHYNEAFKKVEQFIRQHTSGNHKPIMAGHNIGWLPRRIVKGKEVIPNGFDNPFMEIFFKNNKSDFFFMVNDSFYDTLQIAKLKFYELTAYTLSVCANEVGLTLKQAHRAKEDTMANTHFLIKLLKSLKGDGGKETKYVRKKYKLNY